MARILVSLCLAFSNLWCATTCVLPSCKPTKPNQSALPPCHQAPSSEHNTPGGHSDDGTCAHPMVSLAAGLPSTSTHLITHSVDQAIVAYSPAAPFEAWTRFALAQPYHPTPPLRPHRGDILRI